MLDESRHVPVARPSARPAGFARTVIGAAKSQQGPGAILAQVRRAWISIARWGRWCDEQLGEWPPPAVCLAELPGWLRKRLEAEENYEVRNWLDDLHDREWIWWSGAIAGELVKIDLSAESLPISTWMIEYVLEAAGGEVLYSGDWLSLEDVTGGRWVRRR